MFIDMDNGTELTMELNVGSVDRALRIIVGLGLILLAGMGAIGPWGYIGVLLLITGIVRVCPAYAMLNVNTCGTGKRERKGSKAAP
jgi:hypothetical protein